MSLYKYFPDHPLHDVPDEVLAAARQVLQGAYEYGDVAEEMVEPIADAVVMALLPWLPWSTTKEHNDETS